MRLAIRSLLVVSTCALSACDFLPFLELPPSINPSAASWVTRWNRIAIDASGLDHTPVQAGEARTFGHQLGPGKSARATAIVHIAIFESVNAISGGYHSYTGTPYASGNASLQAAIAQSAHDTLVALYPSHAGYLADELAEDLDAIPDGEAKVNGVVLGQDAAARILAIRAGDNASADESYSFSDQPGKWRVDPINPGQQPVGDEWANVPPFVMTRANQFRVPPPPPMESLEYAEAYNEVKELGGDGVVTPTSRTQDQTHIGIYWAYDGTPSLCAPPRLYNQIAVQIGEMHGLSGVEMARMLALVNVAMADAGIAIWESKYYYNVWRPVTGIRESDAGTGPTGLGDGNPLTEGDATYVPLCAPATNLTAPNFTPPFPAYPSGHAGFGGVLFQVLREFFGRDDIAFTFVSDEYNGETLDNQGNVRPLIPRSFTSLSQAEEENGQSRIYLGIHWRFDKVEGIAMGNRIGTYVFEHLYRPVNE